MEITEISQSLVSRDFLLVGNGSYANRGCEAIVRGTMEILANSVGTDERLTVASGVYGSRADMVAQVGGEKDSRLSHFPLMTYPPRWSPLWWQEKVNQRLGMKLPGRHSPLLPHLPGKRTALEVGGDNYTLDYGFPEHLLAMDNWLIEQGVPVIIWGASIGPFHETPELEIRMVRHLARLKAVFVRESVTYDYLTRTHGLRNVSLFADPAFCMASREPASTRLRELIADAPICVNISPLLYSYRTATRKEPWKVTASDLDDWVAQSAEIVAAIAREFRQPILLLPHVGSSLPGIDDFTFLQRVAEVSLKAGVGGLRIPVEAFNAAQAKWLIARCRLVMAARTHATIAGFSSAVPTVSIGYSQKARGINQDIFGSQEYCIPTKDFSAETASAAISTALSREKEIRRHLASAAAQAQSSAMAAGARLLQILAEP